MTKPCQCPWLYDIIVFVFLGDGFLPLAGSLELHHVVLHVPNAEGRVMTALGWGTTLLRDPLEAALGQLGTWQRRDLGVLEI